jgi:hypothetical protein
MGRPRGFVVEELVAAAGDLFWESGYQGSYCRRPRESHEPQSFQSLRGLEFSGID